MVLRVSVEGSKIFLENPPEAVFRDLQDAMSDSQFLTEARKTKDIEPGENFQAVTIPLHYLPRLLSSCEQHSVSLALQQTFSAKELRHLCRSGVLY